MWSCRNIEVKICTDLEDSLLILKAYIHIYMVDITWGNEKFYNFMFASLKAY